MLRKTLFAGAAALAAFIAVSAASTDASAGRMLGGFQNHHAGRMIAGHPHRHIGTGGAHFRRTGGQTRCWDASCGGGVAPISGDYVLRQCNMRPSMEAPLPPWCENVPQPHRKNRGLRY